MKFSPSLTLNFQQLRLHSKAQSGRRQLQSHLPEINTPTVAGSALCLFKPARRCFLSPLLRYTCWQNVTTRLMGFYLVIWKLTACILFVALPRGAWISDCRPMLLYAHWVSHYSLHVFFISFFLSLEGKLGKYDDHKIIKNVNFLHVCAARMPHSPFKYGCKHRFTRHVQLRDSRWKSACTCLFSVISTS